MRDACDMFLAAQQSSKKAKTPTKSVGKTLLRKGFKACNSIITKQVCWGGSSWCVSLCQVVRCLFGWRLPGSMPHGTLGRELDVEGPTCLVGEYWKSSERTL